MDDYNVQIKLSLAYEHFHRSPCPRAAVKIKTPSSLHILGPLLKLSEAIAAHPQSILGA